MMLTRFHLAPRFSGVLLCILLLFLSACSALPVGIGGTPTPGGSGNGTPASGTSTPGQTVTSTPGQTVSLPPTQTDCPTTNTARAAVMRPLALGSSQNL